MARLMQVHIIFPVAYEAYHPDLAPRLYISAAFHAYERRGAYAGIRYVRRKPGYFLPAFPADLAKPDPVFEVRIDPSEELMEVERISRVLYVMAGKSEPFGIKFEAFFDYFLYLSRDLR